MIALFTLLVADAQRDEAHEFERLLTDADHCAAVQDALSFVEINLDAGDSNQIKIQNLAAASAAIERYAAFLEDDMTHAECETLKEEIFA